MTIAVSAHPAYRVFVDSRRWPKTGVNRIVVVRSRICASNIQRLRLLVIAHSIGSLLIGGAPNVDLVWRFVFVCAHTGYYADYMPMYRLPMAVLWHGVMPALTRVFGYFPARSLGLGEDIPAGVAMQWAARRSPELRPEATDPDARRADHDDCALPNVRGRALAIGFTDDAFATPAGTKRLLKVFPALQHDSILDRSKSSRYVEDRALWVLSAQREVTPLASRR